MCDSILCFSLSLNDFINILYISNKAFVMTAGVQVQFDVTICRYDGLIQSRRGKEKQNLYLE